MIGSPKRLGFALILFAATQVSAQVDPTLKALHRQFQDSPTQAHGFNYATRLCELDDFGLGRRVLIVLKRRPITRPYATATLQNRAYTKCRYPVVRSQATPGRPRKGGVYLGGVSKSFADSQNDLRPARKVGDPMEVPRVAWPESAIEREAQVTAAKKQAEGLSKKLFNRPDYVATAPSSSLVLLVPGMSWGTGQSFHASLDRFNKFLRREFDMTEPPFMTTVIATQAWSHTQVVARKLYGLDLPDNTISYAAGDGLTIVASSTRDKGNPQRYMTPGLGSFFHELVHVATRSDFPNPPPWFEEGLAALYEVPEVSGSGNGWGAKGGLNRWRLAAFNAEPSKNPGLKKLLEMSQDEFNAVKGSKIDGRAQARNHSTAWLLVRFLQDRGVLVDVYKCLRKRADKNAGPIDLKALEKLSGTRKLDRSFRKWVKNALRSAGSAIAGVCELPGDGDE